MSGIANATGKEIVLNVPRMTWAELAQVLVSLGDTLLIGSIPEESRPIHERNAAALQAAAEAVLFVGQQHEAIKARAAARCDEYRRSIGKGVQR